MGNEQIKSDSYGYAEEFNLYLNGVIKDKQKKSKSVKFTDSLCYINKDCCSDAIIINKKLVDFKKNYIFIFFV